MEVAEKIVQMPLAVDYVAKLEVEAAANDRATARQAAWIVKRYYDGLLVPALEGMTVAARARGVADETATAVPEEGGVA